MPTPPRPRALATVLVGLATLAAAAGCGSADDSAAQQAQARAQTGLLQSYVAEYALTDSAGQATGTVTVWRTPDRIRLDVETPTGVSTSITTPEGTVACQEPAGDKPPVCLEVAAAGDDPPAAFDPQLRTVFGDALTVLAAGSADRATVALGGTDESGGVQSQCYVVTAVAPSPTATPTTTAPGGTAEEDDGSDDGSDDEPTITDGTYCLTEDGVPTRFDFGTAAGALTRLERTTPTGSAFEPTVSPTPLPTTTS